MTPHARPLRWLIPHLILVNSLGQRKWSEWSFYTNYLPTQPIIPFISFYTSLNSSSVFEEEIELCNLWHGSRRTKWCLAPAPTASPDLEPRSKP